MANQDYAEHLGRAWALHRQGQNDEAIREFNGLLQISTNNMDALYGLGLAQRSAGDIEAAQERLNAVVGRFKRRWSDHPNEDRYEMLEKMAKQRLDEAERSAKS